MFLKKVQEATWLWICPEEVTRHEVLQLRDYAVMTSSYSTYVRVYITEVHTLDSDFSSCRCVLATVPTSSAGLDQEQATYSLVPLTIVLLSYGPGLCIKQSLQALSSILLSLGTYMLFKYRQGPSHSQATHESGQSILTSADGVGDKVLGDWKKKRILCQRIN